MEKVKRGHVLCETCGATQKLDRKDVRRNGWPMHCGLYMKPSSKPVERYEITLQGTGRRIRWCVTRHYRDGSAVRGELSPHEGETDAELIRRARLTSLTIPLYVERETA